jgi:site-specific recombinase XerD
MKTKSINLIGALADYFGSYLGDVKGLSPNTITSYQYSFMLMFRFMNDVKGLPPEKATFEKLSGGAVQEFLCWLETDRGCSAQTRNQRLAAISSFAKYAMRKDFAGSLSFASEILDIPKKKTVKANDVKYFTKEEIAILLGLPDTARRIGRRDAVLMSVLYASGARAQEICDLTLNDIAFGTDAKIRFAGKGGKARYVVIPENCAALLKKHIENGKTGNTMDDSKTRHVFSSQTHTKMTISCVGEVVKKYVALAKRGSPSLFKRDKYSPHSFRHSIAVHMLECGESLAVIRAFLGHSSIATTLVYASVTPELANKYLKERGIALESLAIENNEKCLFASLPFLQNVSKKP